MPNVFERGGIQVADKGLEFPGLKGKHLKDFHDCAARSARARVVQRVLLASTDPEAMCVDITT